MSKIRQALVCRITFCATLIAHPFGVLAQLTNPEIEEIIVSASTVPIEAEKVGSAVTLITAEDIREQGIQYAADALRRVAGVAVNRAGSFGAITQVRLRGAESNHVLVLIDGVEVAAANSGEFDFSALLAEDIERIEVLRGPQSGLYGSNALAGVISVVTRRGAGDPSLVMSLESGSFETTQLTLSAGAGDDRRNGRLGMAYRRADGLNTSQVGSEEDGDRNLILSGRGALSLSRSFWLDGALRFVDKHTDTDDFDFTGGPTQGRSIDAPGRSNTMDVNLAGRASWSDGDGAWLTQLSAAYTGTELDADGSFGPFGSETSRTKLALQTTATLAPSSSRLTHFISGFAELEKEIFRDRFPFDPSQEPELDRTLKGLGIEYRAEVSQRLYLSTTLRHDRNDEFKNATTHRLTAAYVTNQRRTRLHGSHGSAVTNPNFIEQFGFIPNIFSGNPNLQPERSEGWDLGVEHRFDDGQGLVDITYFESTLEDEITTIFPSVINAIGESRRRGVELSFSASVGEHLNLRASYTHLNSEDPDGSKEVRRPEHAASADISYRFSNDRARIYAGFLHNGSMLDNDFTGGFLPVKTRLGSYTLVNVGGAVNVTDRVELYGRIENLSDEEYEEQLSYNTPGRGLFVGIRLSLIDT